MTNFEIDESCSFNFRCYGKWFYVDFAVFRGGGDFKNRK